MTLGKQAAALLALVVALLAVAAPASAKARIQVVRDVAARDALVHPVTSITVVRDIGARPAPTRRPHSITVVRDTPARDARRLERRGASAVAYFWSIEHSRR